MIVNMIMFHCIKYTILKNKENILFQSLCYLSQWHIQHESARTILVYAKTCTGTYELAEDITSVRWRTRNRVNNILCYCQAWNSTWKITQFTEQGLFVSKETVVKMHLRFTTTPQGCYPDFKHRFMIKILANFLFSFSIFLYVLMVCTYAYI